jgi:hypothetical protein
LVRLRPVLFAHALQFFPQPFSSFSRRFNIGTLHALNRTWSVSPMLLGAIRSRFIQMHLQKALAADDQFFASSVAFEFRRYFEWFAGSIEEPDRTFISDQLRVLEELCRKKQPPTGSVCH